MTALKRRHAFKRWAPDIGENRDIIADWQKGGEKGPAPGLWFELATGLAPADISGIRERMARDLDIPEDLPGPESLAAVKTGLRLRYLEAFGKYVRIVGGPHSIEGRPLEKLEDYLSIIEDQSDFGKVAVTDLFTALLSFNSFTGPDELFLQRRSGSLVSTTSVVTALGGP